jgi:hypothetical protein
MVSFIEKNRKKKKYGRPRPLERVIGVYKPLARERLMVARAKV